MYIVEADDNDNYTILLASNDWFEQIDLFMGLEGELSDDYGNFTRFKQIAPQKMIVHIVGGGFVPR